MVKNKVFRALAIVLAVALALAVGTASAYLVSARFAENKLGIGSNEIQVQEDFKPPKEMTVGDNAYTKTVAVRNTGTVPCYIRVYVGFSDGEAESRSSLSPDGGSSYYSVADYRNHLPAGWTVNGDDGYYYYTEVVNPGASTAPLFTNVNTTFESAEAIHQYNIFVYAESVQIIDSVGNEAESALAAWSEFLS